MGCDEGVGVNELPILNRSVLIIEVKEPFIKWLNENSEDTDFECSTRYAVESFNESPQVYLCEEMSPFDSVEIRIDKNWKQMFELQLAMWELDSALWPRNRTREMFDDWFNVKCSALVTDLLPKIELVCMTS